MARRVIIRGGAYRRQASLVSDLEQMVEKDYKEIWKNHLDELHSVAEVIEADATELAPFYTGKLSSSINVRVSRSHRYPGIMATATAKGRGGFDYALIQDTEESYSHEYGQAHYLSQPFAEELSYRYEEVTGKTLQLPEELENAMNYAPKGLSLKEDNNDSK